jgi:hypothetical protein
MPPSNILQDEIKGSFDFFYDNTNFDRSSKGYGLTVDSTRNPLLASIASTGYALTAWVIAAEHGYLSYQLAKEIVRGTLTTLYCSVSHFHGFFAHFLHMDSGERYKKCEFSTIDTAICMNGVITAAAYFRDAQIQEMANILLERVDWQHIVFEKGEQALFHMSYNPDRGGDYVEDQPGFISAWDMSAEQKMMYFQAANHVDPHLAKRLYLGFSRDIAVFDGEPIIISPNGALYIYQCSEAWLDTRAYLDPNGVDWFDNARRVTLANRSFCLYHAGAYRTYHSASWGLSSGDSPSGYSVFGGAPCCGKPWHNGTVSIWGALASLPFLPDLTMEMVAYLLKCHPQTWGPYGFYDAYNLDVSPPWYSHTLYGIDKGCSMIMIENYLSGLVWDVYTSSPYIQNALDVLGWTKR